MFQLERGHLGPGPSPGDVTTRNRDKRAHVQTDIRPAHAIFAASRSNAPCCSFGYFQRSGPAGEQLGSSPIDIEQQPRRAFGCSDSFCSVSCLLLSNLHASRRRRKVASAAHRRDWVACAPFGHGTDRAGWLARPAGGCVSSSTAAALCVPERVDPSSTFGVVRVLSIRRILLREKA